MRTALGTYVTNQRTVTLCPGTQRAFLICTSLYVRWR